MLWPHHSCLDMHHGNSLDWDKKCFHTLLWYGGINFRRPSSDACKIKYWPFYFRWYHQFLNISLKFIQFSSIISSNIGKAINLFTALAGNLNNWSLSIEFYSFFSLRAILSSVFIDLCKLKKKTRIVYEPRLNKLLLSLWTILPQ